MSTEAATLSAIEMIESPDTIHWSFVILVIIVFFLAIVTLWRTR